MRGGTSIRRLLPWLIAAALLLMFVLYVASWFHLGSGSPRYARKWRKQLLACHSLEEVKQHFNYIEMKGGQAITNVTKEVRGRPHALIKSFPNGQWIACAYGDSHHGRGGGTVVARDSSGETHIFFGHVCGGLHVKGETMEEFYTSLRDGKSTFWGKEVFLEE